THNLGWSLVLLAAIIKLALWPLNNTQFRSMQNMQRLRPKMQALQAKFKGDPQKLNQETMALYKAEGVNPAAGCLPMIIQLPILFSVYWAINTKSALFAGTSWLWIGTAFSHAFPKVFAGNLKEPDMVLLVVYAISMFFSFRLTTPTMDPQMAQQQKIMAYMYPVLFGFIGRQWPSALILYWLTFNIFTMGQQFYLIRTAPVGPSLPAAGKSGTPPATNSKTIDPKAIDPKASRSGSGTALRASRKGGARR
ncbi:MAG: YidC/Oxa1 family membrane protein insertase, partial [Vulcanimicrobiaceae bacterium]